MRIGLLGGSFDPPHQGHVHITKTALTRLGLDQVWWLVTPGNPLKTQGPAGIDRRLAACEAIMQHPKVKITDIERKLGTRFTAETLNELRARYLGVRFVWLMGADNMAGFHRWDRWQHILSTTPVAVLARPQEQVRAGLSPAAQAFAKFRVPQSQAAGLGIVDTPAWTILTGPMRAESSTAIRRLGDWP